MKKRIIGILLLLIILTGCKEKKYTVTFMDDNTLLKSIEIKEGEDLRKIENPTKEGYIFVTWMKDGKEFDKNNIVSDNMTLTASWVPEPSIKKKYIITYNYGDISKTQTVLDGEKAEKPSFEPQMEKHAFLGWYDGDHLYNFDSVVTKDIVLQAKFKRTRITINYELDGGSGKKQTEIDIGSIPEKPANPTKFGYDFITWSLNGKPYNFDFPLNSDTTIKAIFEPTVYVTIDFDTDGGSTIDSVVIKKGSTITDLKIPIKEGYTFKYWTLSGTKFDKSMKIDDNMVLKAIYQKNDDEY